MSAYSRKSNMSRQILRAVSINNQDHLGNLVDKENQTQSLNKKLVEDFISKVNKAQMDLMGNVFSQFNHRVNHIWQDYLRHQIASKKMTVNRADLDADVTRLRDQFNMMLTARTAQFIESQKNEIFREIFRKVELNNEQKVYLDEEIGYLVDTQFIEAKKINQELQKMLVKKQREIAEEIEMQNSQFASMSEQHIEAYEREFGFRLSSEDQLGHQTLLSALPIIQERENKLNQKLRLYLNEGKLS
jgi:hypothetical protein